MGHIKPNTGALHPNEKNSNPRSPDFKGQILTDDGKKYDVAGWWNNYSARNGEYLSLKLQPVTSSDPSYDPQT